MVSNACVCPYCYHTISQERPAFRCTGRGDGIKKPCQPGPDEARDLALGLQDNHVLPSFVLTDGVRPVKGEARWPKCNDKTGVRVCPTCHTPLPSGLSESASPLIGMVGAKQTGKTVFMTVLLHQLQNGIARRYDAAVDIVGDMPDGRSAATAWTIALERPLFSDRRMVGQTRQGNGGQPRYLVQWRQSRRILFFDRTKTMAMSFSDQSGEDQTRQDSVNAHHYLSAASGLMVLLDPLQLPMVRDVVAVPERAMIAGGEPPISVLSRVTELLRSSHGVPSKKKVRIPVAVVFSKVDALFSILGDNHPIRQVNGSDSVRDDGASVHEHVRRLLHQWSAHNLY